MLRRRSASKRPEWQIGSIAAQALTDGVEQAPLGSVPRRATQQVILPVILSVILSA